MQMDGGVRAQAVMQSGGDAASVFLAGCAHQQQIAVRTKAGRAQQTEAHHQHGHPGEIVGDAPAVEAAVLDRRFERIRAPGRLLDKGLGIRVGEQQEAPTPRRARSGSIPPTRTQPARRRIRRPARRRPDDKPSARPNSRHPPCPPHSAFSSASALAGNGFTGRRGAVVSDDGLDFSVSRWATAGRQQRPWQQPMPRRRRCFRTTTPAAPSAIVRLTSPRSRFSQR